MTYSENASWIIEVGDNILEKEAGFGYDQLSEIEQLIICFWTLDYSVRNAGSLDALEDFNSFRKADLKRLARNFQLIGINETFNAKTDLEMQSYYYASFDQNCETLKKNLRAI